MLSSIPITVFFIGLFALIQVPLTVIVGYRRAQTGIQFLDGGDQTLLRRMRAHGNFTENVPIVLLAMAAAEMTLLPQWALWAGGATLLIGRVLHAVYLIAKAWGNPRAFAMILTFLPMAGFGAWAVYKSVF